MTFARSLTVRPVDAVTRATPLTAFQSANSQVDVIPQEAGRAAFPRWRDIAAVAAPNLSFSIHNSLAAVESEWRRFERIAEGTPFQTYEWLAAWYRHIGIRDSAVPAVVRPFRRRRNRIHPAARHRLAARAAAAALARPGSVRLQRAAIVARFLATRHA